MKQDMQPGVCQNYYQIENAMGYMASHRQMSPSVERLAEAAKLEVDEFRRIFTDWSDVDPETFSRKLSSQLTKRENSNKPDLFDTADDMPSSSKSWHYDRFLNISRMEPENCKDGGKSLVINYSVQHTPFGRMMVASAGKGICRVSFLSEEQQCSNILEDEFPEAEIKHDEKLEHIIMADFFGKPGLPESMINLHVKGTPFQITVWKTLLHIPEGELSCCSDVAMEINNPKALRAVGSAVGKNPIAFFIPCHRIVPAAGDFGNYRWGINRKIAMIGWEAVRISKESE
ncbi:methylated-DNA--[protein]-cysteine S-methyltransferase [Rhodohalobacter sp. 8-1]|uniref:methylated-DNA--[protein]-cysteine S-methyltransferase n=1 Tax=Rhodohalobacter sp. 8-1 TaxID=3131972 RepID=UPI0030EDACF4